MAVNLELHKSVFNMYAQVSKAFDSINRSVLLNKMGGLGEKLFKQLNAIFSLGWCSIVIAQCFTWCAPDESNLRRTLFFIYLVLYLIEII